LRERNARRRAGATRRRASGRLLAALAAALAIWTVAPAAAETGPVPSAGETMAAYRTLESWIRAWEIPAEPARIDPEHASGACVTLRLGGRIIGRGVAMGESGETVWRAARQAWVEANQRSPVARDATKRERLKEQAAAVAIDLQVAGALTPLTAPTRAEAAMSIAPGLEGAAARIGERVSAVFPGQSLSGNLTAQQTLDAAIGLLDLAPLPLTQLREQRDLRIYRFGAQHLAQVDPDRPPLFLFRGGRVRALTDVTPGALRSAGESIASHLEERMWPGEEALGLLGVYQPWIDEFETPLVAGAREQALAAFALGRWAETPGVSDAASTGARRLALSILRELETVEESETPAPDDPAAAALVRLAMIELGEPEEEPLRALSDACHASVTAWAQGEPEASPPALRALVACALARSEVKDDRALARDLARSAHRDTSIETLASAMPWLGWADVWLAGEGERIGAAPGLRQFRALVWDHQVEPGEAAEDLAGGVVFTRGAAALPTWQTLRPAAFLATSIGDPRLTDADERAREMSRLLASLRFLLQLSAGEATMHIFPNPARARGGVRLATWDQRQSVEASALGLLTLAETMRSVHAFGR